MHNYIWADGLETGMLVNVHAQIKQTMDTTITQCISTSYIKDCETRCGE